MGPGMLAQAEARIAELESELAAAKADRDDYERRWLAAERARGIAERAAAVRAIELDVDAEDLCTCATSGAYLCLRCERIAEDQDIGF